MPHKDPEARRRYLATNKERIAARQHAYYLANRDEIRKQAKTYEIAYKEKRRAIDAQPQNKAKRRAYTKQYWHDRPDKVAENNRKIKPKRTDTERTNIRNQVLLAGRPRPDKCDICSMATKRIVFDHCHQRGHFRGWLCERCNHALGMVQDDVQHLRKLIAYLERTRENTSPQHSLPGI